VIRSRALGAVFPVAMVVPAVMVAGAAGPAFADSAAATPSTRSAAMADGRGAVCAAEATQLAVRLSSLLAVSPSGANSWTTATALAEQMVGDVGALQSSGCLPQISPAGRSVAPACLPDTAQLLSDDMALVVALTKSAPDLNGAVTAATAQVTDMNTLTTDACLPSVPLPSLPGQAGAGAGAGADGGADTDAGNVASDN
jgi:hypothetical protein